jgi:hypothetical protein
MAKIGIVENFVTGGDCDLVIVVGTTALFGYIIDWAGPLFLASLAGGQGHGTETFVTQGGGLTDAAVPAATGPPRSGVTDKVLSHLESMQPNSILDRVHDIEKYDRLARRNYGLPDNQSGSNSLNLNILAGRGRTLIAIDQQATATPAQDEP